MFHTPMSSPMMMMMFGFLPPFSAGWPPPCPLPRAKSCGGLVSSQQAGFAPPLESAGVTPAAWLIGGLASARANGLSFPDAVAYLRSAPTATNATAVRFLRLNMVLLQGELAAATTTAVPTGEQLSLLRRLGAPKSDV